VTGFLLPGGRMPPYSFVRARWWSLFIHICGPCCVRH